MRRLDAGGDKPATPRGLRRAACLAFAACLAGLLAAFSGHPASAQGSVQMPGQTPQWAPYLRVPVLYATNRNRLNSAGPRSSFGELASQEVTLGMALVHVPSAHRIGQLELPSFSILERRLRMPRLPRHPDREFGLETVAVLSSAEFYERAAPPANGGRRLLYVPSRTGEFNEDVQRTAQIAYDLSYGAPIVMFSWPASGALSAYIRDRDMALRSTQHVAELLRELLVPARDGLDIIAFGQGAVPLLRAVTDLGLTGKGPASPIKNIVLVIPDIGVDEFTISVAPRLAAMGIRVTVYAVPDHLEMRAAAVISTLPRLGGAPAGSVTTTGFDLVLLDRARLGTLEADHQGIAPVFYRDLDRLLRSGAPPADRRLRRAGTPPNVHWIAE